MSSEHDKFSYSKNKYLYIKTKKKKKNFELIKIYLFFHMDMFEDLVEDKNHIDLYDIYVYNDEFDNLIIDYMAKNNQNMKTFRKKNGSYLLDHIENLVHYNFL